MNTHTKRGFGPLLIIVALAIVLAAGGGVYYAAKHPKKASDQQSGVSASTTANVSVQNNGGNHIGTLKDILALGSNQMCTVSATNATSSVSGTAYVSGSMMRGDFMMKSSGVTIDSHMIRNGNDVYFWAGNKGGHMNINLLEAQSKAGAQTSVDWKQNVNYNCVSWTKDTTKFVVPTSVNIVDFDALMKGAGVNINTTGGVNVQYH